MVGGVKRKSRATPINPSRFHDTAIGQMIVFLEPPDLHPLETRGIGSDEFRVCMEQFGVPMAVRRFGSEEPIIIYSNPRISTV